jgi:hypothetical protein
MKNTKENFTRMAIRRETQGVNDEENAAGTS